VIISPSAANLDQPDSARSPLATGSSAIVAPVGGGPVGEIVRFVEENGRVVRMFTGDGFVERVQ
jgi:hypothetical protein